MAEEVEKALGEYKKAMADITSATAGDKNAGGAGGSGAPSVGDDRNDTSALVSAVASLPQLQERKRVIDKHTNIATALLGEIKTRGLDEYHVVEEDLLAGKGDRAAMMGLLDATGRGSPEDKLRLAIVRGGGGGQEGARRARGRDGAAAASASDAEAVEGALRASGADRAALEFFQRGELTPASRRRGPGRRANSHGHGGRRLRRRRSALTGRTSCTASPSTRWPRACRACSAATAGRRLAAGRGVGVEPERVAEVDSLACADRRRRSRSGARAAGAASRAACGGVPGPSCSSRGNYAEYRECVALGKSGEGASRSASGTDLRARVVYGATELVTGAEFVGQLAELGRKTRR